MASYNYYWNGLPECTSPYPMSAGVSTVPVMQPAQKPTQTLPADDRDAVTNLDLKVLNPRNKKDFRMYVLRQVSSDLDSPNKLRNEIIEQYGEITKLAHNMEMGYFQASRKVWINSRLDVNDLWSLVAKGEKITVWCVGSDESMWSGKRNYEPGLENKENNSSKKLKVSTGPGVESQKELVKEYELDLKKKHEGAYSPFQYKLWAEMYAKGVHSSLEDPPAAAMFNREKLSRSSTTKNDFVVSVLDKVCNALAPTTQNTGKASLTLSPLKKAELRSTYIKQLSELKSLNESGILTNDEYEEQREELVKLMRQLKNKD